LQSIGAYIADVESIETARRVVVRLREAIRGLSTFPGRGRPGRAAGTRELVLSNLPYIVVYRLEELPSGARQVEVLRVLHGHQQWPPQPRQD